jgi:hypothetical protein
MKAQFCPTCGEPRLAGAAFCGRCGTELRAFDASARYSAQPLAPAGMGPTPGRVQADRPAQLGVRHPAGEATGDSVPVVSRAHRVAHATARRPRLAPPRLRWSRRKRGQTVLAATLVLALLGAGTVLAGSWRALDTGHPAAGGTVPSTARTPAASMAPIAAVSGTSMRASPAPMAAPSATPAASAIEPASPTTTPGAGSGPDGSLARPDDAALRPTPVRTPAATATPLSQVRTPTPTPRPTPDRTATPRPTARPAQTPWALPSPTPLPTLGPLTCASITSNAYAQGPFLFTLSVTGIPDTIRPTLAIYDATRAWDAYGSFTVSGQPFVANSAADPVVWMFSVAFTRLTGVIQAGDTLDFQFRDSSDNAVLGQCSTTAPRAG